MLTQERVIEYFNENLDVQRSKPGWGPSLDALAYNWTEAINTYVDDGVAQDLVAVATMHTNMVTYLGLSIPDAPDTYSALLHMAVTVA